MIRLTRAQVREIDRRATEQYHIPGIVLMENAALAVTRAAMEMRNAASGGSALVVCGGGNNGGDGLAVARHLHNRSVDVQIALAVDPSKYLGDALINWRIVEAMDLPRFVIKEGLPGLRNVAMIVDAIFGTGLSQPPREPFPELAKTINTAGIPVLAVDLPSGLDCDTGKPLGSCIRATKTVTFVAEKVSFANPESKQYTGEVIVGDIGCPRELIEQVVREMPA